MSDAEEKSDLAGSFRQSRRELWVMLAAWVVFAVWTVGYNAKHAFSEADSGMNPVWGMPRWVTFGIAVPWIAGLLLTIWFAMRFMKDTPLDGEAPASGREEEGK